MMLWLLTFFVASLLLLFVYYVISLTRLHRNFVHIPGPPLDSFFFGNAPSLMKSVENGGHFFGFVLDNLKKYGPTIKLVMVNKVIVFTVDPEAVKELLITGQHMKPPDVYQQMNQVFGERFLGNGILTVQNHAHQPWANVRARMQAFFNKRHIRKMVLDMNEGVTALMQRLSDKADDQTAIRMLPQFSQTTLSVVAKVLCGMDVHDSELGDTEFHRNLTLISLAIIEKGRNPVMEYNPFRFGYCREVRKACRYLRQRCYDIVKERREAQAKGNYVPDDFLTEMLRLQEEFGDIDDEFILDDLLTFIVAGHETSGNLLSFILCCLGKNEEVLDRLEKEVDSVVGSKTIVEFDDLEQMPYMDMVVKETLRIHSPSAATYRFVPQPFKIKDLKIPAFTTICLSPYASHHWPEYFPKPDHFDPERFSKDSPKVLPGVYFPFSAGARVCIGRFFSDVEVKIILARFLQSFHFRLVPEQSFDIKEVLLHMPRDGALCFLAPK